MKKYLFLFLTLLCMINLASCKKKSITYNDLEKVTYENILSLPKGKYIVVAYQANCENCDKLLESVQTYYEFANKHSSAMPIYAINVNLAINKKMLLSSSDSYPSNMVGTTKYTNIKVKATPSIMVISNGKLEKVIYDYNTKTPVSDAQKYFEELMK